MSALCYNFFRKLLLPSFPAVAGVPAVDGVVDTGQKNLPVSSTLEKNNISSSFFVGVNEACETR